MSELIDRTDTVKQICKIAHELCGHDENVLISIALFIQDDKKSFPTVERPHGEWIQDDELCFDPMRPWWYCSNCRERTGIRTKYCPECGSENKKDGD